MIGLEHADLDLRAFGAGPDNFLEGEEALGVVLGGEGSLGPLLDFHRLHQHHDPIFGNIDQKRRGLLHRRRLAAGHAGNRQNPRPVDAGQRALRAGVILAERFDMVVEKFDTQRASRTEGKNIHDPAAHRELAR